MTRNADPATTRAQAVVSLLEQHRSEKVLHEMGPRYGIHAASAIGVSMADMKAVARQTGKDHELAEALWQTGIYEAQSVAALVDVSASVTAEQMDRWCADFDNWAICDTVCFTLFDKAAPAWGRVGDWSAQDEEFVKRAAFALLWSLALHDKSSGNEPFLQGLVLIEREAHDDRSFVSKAVAMALRAIGRRNPVLATASLEVAHRLALSSDRAAAGIGRRAVKEMTTAREESRK